MTILATLVVLGVLILVHELGHYWAAKALGVQVQRFSIGLGPKIVGFRRGETEYVVAAIPLGGYVKMGGMGDEAMEKLEGSSAIQTPPERAFDNKPLWARTVVILAGVAMNMLFAFAAFTGVAAVWGVRAEPETTEPVVGLVSPSGPAAEAGIEPGDLITDVMGTPVASWTELVREIEARPGERVTFGLSREGRDIVRIAAVEAVEVELADGTETEIGRIGIVQELGYVDLGAGEAVVHGLRQTVAVTVTIIDFLASLATGQVSPRDVGSVFTIGEASGQAAALGLDSFLAFMALFSINLAVLNLLPIPVLDGGHLVFLAIEAVRGGKPLTARQRLKWSNVGFLVVLGIMAWALSNDVLRLLGL